MVIYHIDARNNTNLPNDLIHNENTTLMLLLFLTITLLNGITWFAYIFGILNRGIKFLYLWHIEISYSSAGKSPCSVTHWRYPCVMVFYSIRYNVFCYRVKKQRGRMLLQADGKWGHIWRTACGKCVGMHKLALRTLFEVMFIVMFPL